MSHWWNEIPWRMVQTNLRQIAMQDMDAEAYVRELQAFHATVVLLNTAGIQFIDHIIFSGRVYCSMADLNLI